MIAASHIAFASGLGLGGFALLGYPADLIAWAIADGPGSHGPSKIKSFA